ncbi:MAG: hypothetical protein M3Z66_04010, partial [Chloroflexota bacterium]|nr:hypothetical protein [Chloroflexota bacterium]
MPSRLVFLSIISIIISVGVYARPSIAAATTGYDWLQFDGNAQHSGNNTQETIINRSNVSGLRQLYRVPLVSGGSPSVADGAPAYLSAVSTPGGMHNLLFITTKDGHILAIDADTGNQIWSQQYGPNGCIINHNNQRHEPCYSTSSPAIDPNRQYVYSYGLGATDGQIHKYAVGTGQEVVSGGWPETVSIKDWNEKGSSALATATVGGTSYLYAASAGYPGDQGDYQGHVTTINLTTGSQHVFNALCSNQVDAHLGIGGCTSGGATVTQAAVWGRSGVVYDANTRRIYFTTGNGNFNASAHQWGDSVLALNPDGTGQSGSNSGLPLDSYTPSNYSFLQNTDLDLGSTAPAILAPVVVNGQTKYLAVQGGKGPATTSLSDPVVLRLIDLSNLSGQGSPGHVGGELSVTDVPQGG